MTRGHCYIGTSGWSYPHWAKGRFYPRGLKPGDWLGFLAEHFNTVEVNSSFYRLPRPELIARWREVTGRRFRFAVKLWRRITHEKRLAGCGSELRDFLGVARELGPKRGPLLVQLPPSLRKDVELLAEFLDTLKDVSCAAGAGVSSRSGRWRFAVEFRSHDWLCDEVYELLSWHSAAVCLADLPRCPVTRPNVAPASERTGARASAGTRFVYIRRHGPGGRYRGCYSPEQIAADATAIGGWLASGYDVYVYYNNDIDGHAVDNARQLMAAVGV